MYKRECRKSGVEAMIQFANLHGQVDSRSEAGTGMARLDQGIICGNL